MYWFCRTNVWSCMEFAGQMIDPVWSLQDKSVILYMEFARQMFDPVWSLQDKSVILYMKFASQMFDPVWSLQDKSVILYGVFRTNVWSCMEFSGQMCDPVWILQDMSVILYGVCRINVWSCTECLFNFKVLQRPSNAFFHSHLPCKKEKWQENKIKNTKQIKKSLVIHIYTCTNESPIFLTSASAETHTHKHTDRQSLDSFSVATVIHVCTYVKWNTVKRKLQGHDSHFQLSVFWVSQYRVSRKRSPWVQTICLCHHPIWKPVCAIQYFVLSAFVWTNQNTRG